MNIVSYSFGSMQVRTTEKDGQVWFVAKDVAAALEYSEDSNASRLFASVPEEWKGVNRIHTLGGEQDMLTITEQGLYFFLGRSDKPKALPFQKWVAGEILPSIRKTGSYTTKPTKPANQLEQQLEVAKFILDAAGITGNQQALSLNNFVRAKTGEDYLALTGTQLVAPQPTQLLTPTQLGEHLGLSAIKVNQRLEALGLQFKTPAGWQPTDAGLAKGAVMLDTGKRRSSGVPVRQLKWPVDILESIKW